MIANSNIEKVPIAAQKIRVFSQALSTWAKTNLRDFPWRKSNISAYQLVLTELLLQRTRAQTVKKIYLPFFKKYPSWEVINRTSIRVLEKHLTPLGLYKRRSVALKALASAMVSSNGCFPEQREKIDELPGVGQYIGNAIELFVFSKRTPLLDVNMARVLERYIGPRTLVDIRYDPHLQSLSKGVVEVAANPVKINWAIIDFGALVCKKKNPFCGGCILASNCWTRKIIYTAR